ncbi:protein NYNRIN isoform 1-T1 [Rhynchonycteris naso]
MLLAGGDPPAQEWVMVQTKSKPRVQRQRLQVQRIFRVKLNAFQSRPDSPYFWLQLEGPRENLGKAKEYLKGLCNPELWKEVRYPAALHCAFLGAQGLFLDCLCWSTLAYLVPGPPGSLMVGGLTESFIMTQNWLEELVGRLRWGPAPLFTPRGIWEAEVTRAFGALVWIRGDQYAGDLLQLPPAVQELLLSLVRDAAGKEDIIEWLSRVSAPNARSDPEVLICPPHQQKEASAMTSVGDGPGPLLEIRALQNGSAENSKKLTCLGAAAGQNTQQETANQLVRHGLQHFFSCRGIAMAVQYFWNRGHREVTVFVPTWQLKKNRRVRESHFLTKLHSLKMLSITPSQLENGKKITTYDYRFMIKLAEETDGIIVTNEQLHILMNNSKKLMVKDRLLPFTFAGNLFMVPDDPLGRDGPTLDEFLRKPNRLDTDIGNFLKVWKALPPSSASSSELSDTASPEPLESPQKVEEVREEKEERQDEEPRERQDVGQRERQGTQSPAEEEDLDSSLASVFKTECPSLSEEILRCLSLQDPPDGALDIDLLPAVASPSLGIPWDGKAPCQQVLAHLAQMTIPSNFTALSFFVGFMDSHRDVIPDYEALVGPLHSLLKQKPEWQWDQEHEKAFLALKRALVSALCLTAPNSQLPFRLEVTVSQVALTASVYQKHSGRNHPIAYTSKPLLPDEESEGPQSGGDSPYAVAWALKHFSRCIGDTPVVLDLSYAARTTVDPEAWEGHRVSKAWLIRWSLLVQDKGKRALELTLLQGLLGENRLLTPASSMPRFFQSLPPFSDLSTFVCIHMSGYCFYREDEWCAGFGLYVLSPTSPPVSLSFSCSPHTPTYAHLAAVACGLERFSQSHLPVVFLTHCNWVFSLLWELLPLWKARGFLSSDGSPLPHPNLLSYIISLTSGLSSPPFIYRTSYRGSLFAVTVDTLAKQGAQGGGQFWNLPMDVPVPIVSPHTMGKRPNLRALQLSDSTLADIIAKLQAGQKLSGSSPFSSAFNSLSLDKESGLLLFKGDKKPKVWVVPRQLRRDLIFSVHDLPVGAHQRPEETYKKLRLLGWWPGMQEHVRDYCRSCLFCIPRNLPGSELKVIESLWPLRSTAPWSNLQIEVVGPITISEEGHKHVLIVADPNTRWVEAFPLKPYTHMAVAQVLLQHVFARWGVPVRLEAAQGPQFARHVLVSCGLALGVQAASLSRDLQFPCLTSSGAYWEFKRALKEFIFLHGKKWATSLPLLHLAFRASSPQATPFQILTGGQERLMEPLWWEMSSANIEGLKMDVFLLQMMGELLELHLRVADKGSEKAENRHFKQESQEKEWNVGDQVLLLSLPRNGSSAKWVGPFYIGDRLSLSLYRVWGFPTPEKLGCIYPSSLMKSFAKSGTPLSFKVLEQ